MDRVAARSAGLVVYILKKRLSALRLRASKPVSPRDPGEGKSKQTRDGHSLHVASPMRFQLCRRTETLKGLLVKAKGAEEPTPAVVLW